ncbi:MAG: ComEC/Rec2 family competence protein, partial [Gloeobacteraceae cyanobacterium ES-bin-316]|nr:ComEC/Rec2 family competence protein [Ferruginibacter sp.]
VLQWYIQFSLSYLLLCLFSFLIAFLLTYFFSPSGMYYVRKFQGVLFYLFMVSVGLLLTWQNDSRQLASWYGRYYSDSSSLLVKINEPLIEKARSFKAEGTVVSVIDGERQRQTTGKLLLYFSKDSARPELKYGQLILVKKNMQPIKNSGNPGAFNYQRYAAFQQVYQQLFLQPQDWVATAEVQPNKLRSFLYNSRQYILDVLKQYISNNHQQLGIAEALLIGYKEDLDKDLVQAYSNTGVVHIIAISGLHLGLIYAVLLWLLNHLPWIKKSRHVKVLLLISCLWLFSLLTGGAASVLRSAVMFTVIVLGKYYFRQSSVYNSLAASAFILLCYNPYYLWDVGFQLSYLAVIGIIALQQPLYRSLYFKNNVVRKIWQMLSVTIAAQVAAFPICIYYFHQFPNFFLFTNLLVIPLSTIILFAEIVLVLVSAVGLLATSLGTAISWSIYAMNRIILFFSSFSFSVWDNIYANMYTTWLLYGMVTFVCGWYVYRNKKLLIGAFLFLVGFAALHLYARIQLYQQQKMVIYNVSKHSAIDFIVQDKHFFLGDQALKEEGLLQNFHLKPARISLQATKAADSLPSLIHQNFYWQFLQKKMIVIDSTVVLQPVDSIISIDILLISRNPAVKIKELTMAVMPAVVVFDASNNLWKIENWEKECEELHLRSHSVAKEGAFILDIKK